MQSVQALSCVSGFLSVFVSACVCVNPLGIETRLDVNLKSALKGEGRVS